MEKHWSTKRHKASRCCLKLEMSRVHPALTMLCCPLKSLYKGQKNMTGCDTRKSQKIVFLSVLQNSLLHIQFINSKTGLHCNESKMTVLWTQDITKGVDAVLIKAVSSVSVFLTTAGIWISHSLATAQEVNCVSERLSLGISHRQ